MSGAVDKILRDFGEDYHCNDSDCPHTTLAAAEAKRELCEALLSKKMVGKFVNGDSDCVLPEDIRQLFGQGEE
ncbi:hypothetical protein FWH13_03035 [Candidatus Saccharibacteria bacterium]|nr:hypothetical protein [Candidatus Saccharibacteria bacterium]